MKKKDDKIPISTFGAGLTPKPCSGGWDISISLTDNIIEKLKNFRKALKELEEVFPEIKEPL